jgi:class 3 adenylate cyclase/tetratricopeptide (TPR) repeat protein
MILPLMAGDPIPLPEGTVTVLSTDLVGSTVLNQRLGDEAATTMEREIADLAQVQVEKQRGVVIMHTGDGLMVAFQSARRAVACAQEIQRGIARLNRSHPEITLQLRIGLHTGEVVNDEGGLHGETLIVAKRIESVAPGAAILASDTVRGVLGTARSELQDRGEFSLKGIDAPWHLWEVPWADAETTGVLPGSARTPFVARGTERARLLRAVERARDGAGTLLLLVGEAGVGKTRLVEEAAAEARRLGLRVLTGHCVDQQGAPPYLPTIEHIEEAARQVPPETLRRALGENAPEIAKLMPELRVRYTDIPDPVTLPPEQERRYLLHGVSEFVERSARATPLVLVFEDLHWADESTLLLVQHMAQRLPQMPVLVLGTYRDTELRPGRPLAAVLPGLLRQRLAEEIAVRRLGEDGVASLLEGRAGSKPPAELVALVYSETEGNPFFVEEVFRHLHESGKLFDEAGRWRSGVQITESEVPRSVGLVIGQRLERVSDDCRGILTLAALAGKTFRVDLLAVFHGVDEDRLLAALEEAVNATLIEDVSTGREARYAFIHEQIRQTLLALLSTARRQRLHLRMADALEALHRGDAEAHAPDVAYHLYQAGAAADGRRTAAWLVRAAERALDALAFEDALRDLDAARTVLPAGDAEGVVRLLRLRARALRGLARIDEALAAFAQALEIAPSGAERDAVLQARARLRLDLFRGREAIDDLDPLLARARAAGDRAREVELLLMRSRGLYVLSLDEPGYAEPTRASYEEAYALAKEIGDKRAMCQALIPTAWFVDYWHEYRDRAIANSDEARALAAELGDEELEIDAASTRLGLVTADSAHEEALRILARLEARRDPLRLKEHLFWLMWQYFMRGEFEQCVATCDAGIALAAQLGSPPVQYATIKGLALTDLGRFDEAWASFQAEVADEAHRFGRCMRELGIAAWLESVSALDRAEVAARAVLEEAGRLSRTWMQRFTVDLLTVIAARRGASGVELAAWIAKKRDDHAVNVGGRLWFHASPLAEAEAALARGESAQALEVADRFAEGSGRVGLGRGRIVALEIGLRALAQMERWDDLVERAATALEEAEGAGFRTRAWRILASRARARDAKGDQTGASDDRSAALKLVDEMAGRITDPELRAAFESDATILELKTA